VTSVFHTNTAESMLNRRVEDLEVLRRADETLMAKRGYVVEMPEKGESVVACLSGGLDSVCNLEVLMGEFGLNVYPFFINRKQTNYRWEKKAKDFFEKYFLSKYPDLMHEIIEIDLETPAEIYNDDLRNLKSLTDKFPYRHDVAYPARNPLIFLAGMEYAYSLQAKGINPKTIFGTFMKSDNLYHSSLTTSRLLNLLMCQITGDWEFQFISIPIEREFGNCYDKDVYVKYCIEKGVPLEHSRSCVSADEIQCGKCPACWDRRHAFIVNGIKDSTPYQYPWTETPPYPVI